MVQDIELVGQHDWFICHIFTLYSVCSVHQGVFSTVHQRDTMSTLGDIMSTSGGVHYVGGYHDACGGYHDACGGYHKYIRGCSVHWGIP